MKNFVRARPTISKTMPIKLLFFRDAGLYWLLGDWAIEMLMNFTIFFIEKDQLKMPPFFKTRIPSPILKPLLYTSIL